MKHLHRRSGRQDDCGWNSPFHVSLRDTKWPQRLLHPRFAPTKLSSCSLGQLQNPHQCLHYFSLYSSEMVHSPLGFLILPASQTPNFLFCISTSKQSRLLNRIFFSFSLEISISQAKFWGGSYLCWCCSRQLSWKQMSTRLWCANVFDCDSPCLHSVVPPLMVRQKGGLALDSLSEIPLHFLLPGWRSRVSCEALFEEQRDQMRANDGVCCPSFTPFIFDELAPCLTIKQKEVAGSLIQSMHSFEAICLCVCVMLEWAMHQYVRKSWAWSTLLQF